MFKKATISRIEYLEKELRILSKKFSKLEEYFKISVIIGESIKDDSRVVKICEKCGHEKSLWYNNAPKTQYGTFSLICNCNCHLIKKGKK